MNQLLTNKLKMKFEQLGLPVYNELNRGKVVEFHFERFIIRIVTHMRQVDLDLKLIKFTNWFDVDLCYELLTNTRLISENFDEQIKKLDLVVSDVQKLKENDLISLGTARLLDN